METDKKEKKETDKHLKLRATPNSALAKVITKIQNDPINNQELAAATLRGRFLPFAIDKDDPSFREMAIRCANECEAWAKAIREYAGLGVAPSFSSMDLGLVDRRDNYSDYQDELDDEDEDDEYEEEEIDPEEESRKKQRREGNMGI